MRSPRTKGPPKSIPPPSRRIVTGTSHRTERASPGAGSAADHGWLGQGRDRGGPCSRCAAPGEPSRAPARLARVCRCRPGGRSLRSRPSAASAQVLAAAAGAGAVAAARCSARGRAAASPTPRRQSHRAR